MNIQKPKNKNTNTYSCLNSLTYMYMEKHSNS